MKRTVLALVAMMTMTAAMAQSNEQQAQGQRRQFDRTEMIKQRTDDAVKKYGLSEDQAAKLLELNTKYADKMGPGMGGRGGRGMRPRPNFGNAQQGQRPEMTEEIRQRMETMRKERQAAQEEYDKEMKTILSEDQYKAYKADQEQMRNRMGGRRGGNRNRQQ